MLDHGGSTFFEKHFAFIIETYIIKLILKNIKITSNIEDLIVNVKLIKSGTP